MTYVRLSSYLRCSYLKHTLNINSTCIDVDSCNYFFEFTWTEIEFNMLSSNSWDYRLFTDQQPLIYVLKQQNYVRLKGCAVKEATKWRLPNVIYVFVFTSSTWNSFFVSSFEYMALQVIIYIPFALRLCSTFTIPYQLEFDSSLVTYSARSWFASMHSSQEQFLILPIDKLCWIRSTFIKRGIESKMCYPQTQFHQYLNFCQKVCVDSVWIKPSRKIASTNVCVGLPTKCPCYIGKFSNWFVWKICLFSTHQNVLFIQQW